MKIYVYLKKATYYAKTGIMKTRQNDVDLHEKVHRLQSLVESFASVNASLDLKTVLVNTLKTATKLMDAETGSIALLDKEYMRLRFVESTDPDFEKLKTLYVPFGKGIVGTVAQSGQSMRLEDIHADSRFYEKIDQEMRHTTGAYICAPLLVHEQVIGTAQVMNPRHKKVFSQSDVELLEGFAHQAALAIENARAHELQLKQQSIDAEMQLCAELQTSFFPQEQPRLQGLEYYGCSLPAKEVGGDYYNYFQYDKNCMDIILADIAGKGLPAALLVSQLHTSYQLLANPCKPLAQTALELNNFFCSTLVQGRFLTAFIARIYQDREELEYVLAGHPSPFLLRAACDPSYASAEAFVRTGPMIGFKSDHPPQVKKISFLPGDLIVAFSDGYSEAQNSRGEFWGEELLYRVIQEHRKESLRNIHNLIDKDLLLFQEEPNLRDDATILMLRRKTIQ